MQRNLDDTALHNSVIINTTVPSRRHAPEGFVKLKDTLFIWLGYWKWFVIALIIAAAGAYYYLQSTPSIYRATASIMIKADEKSLNNEDVIRQLGLKSPGINITNEIMSLKTIGVTQEIVSRLGLDTECFHKGAFHDELAYGINLPVKVKFTDIAESDDASMRLELQADSTVRISDLHLNNRPLEGTFTFKLGKTVKTPMGKISVLPSLNYVGGSKDNLLVIRRPLRETCNDINARIQARQRDAKASIIDFYFDDVSRTRAEDILSTLINVYNENWVKDRNQITNSTTDFIKDRLAIIESELGNVESNISSYKSRNLMPDVAAAGGMAYNQLNASQEVGREIQKIGRAHV